MTGLTALFGALRKRGPDRSLLIHVAGDTDDDRLLAAGATAALVERFERVSGVDVIGPVSARVAPTGDASGDLATPTDFVLRGRLASIGDAIRIEAEMRGPTGRSSWREAWTRPAEEVFEIHGEIAGHVADAVGVALPAGGGDLIHREPTSDPTAYRAYLEGRALLDGGGREALERALDRFQAAVDLDALFADAWTGIADVHRLALERGRSLGSVDPVEAVKEAASVALDLDPSAAGPRLAQAHVDFRGWQLEDAEARIRDVIGSAPGHARAHRDLAGCLCHQGRFEEATAAADRAAELEPLDPTVVNESGWPYALAGDTSEAIERSRRAVRLDPEHAMTYFHLGQYAQQAGRAGEAVTCFRAAAELSGGLPFLSAFLGMALATVGERDEAHGLATDLERKARRGSRVAACLGGLLARLGRTSAALRWLEAALEGRETLLLMADTHWLPLPELRHDPRFRALIERLPHPSAAGRRP